jgi:hypothetical protein
MERQQDTRRKIQLGGLLIKAGLAGEDAGVLLGALLDVKDCLAGEDALNVRATWLAKGRAAFAQGKTEPSPAPDESRPSRQPSP